MFRRKCEYEGEDGEYERVSEVRHESIGGESF
jgi:hypothetical protein